jgi:hypothetical protein
MTLFRRLGLFLLVGLLLIPILPVHAATLTVTDCSAESGAAGRLAEIIASATSGDDIVFSCGTATIPFSAQITISQNITIDGANTITLDGGSATHMFTVSSGFTVTMSNLTFQNGYDGSNGGAIANNGGILTVNNSTFTNNDAFIYGGAIGNNVGTLTVNNSTFTGNTSGNGGAIENSGALIVTGSTFSLNTATTAGGGGAIASSAIATIISSNFISNNAIATSAGAIINVGTMSISGSIFTNNSATSGEAIVDASGITIDTTAFINNTCTLSALTDNGGNTADLASVGCPGWSPAVALATSASCVGADLQILINAGDPLFSIIADSGTLSAAGGLGSYTYVGPITETNVTVTEFGGDMQTINLGDFNCSVSTSLAASVGCLNGDLQLHIISGDLPVNATGTGPGFPTSYNATGFYYIAGNNLGPTSWSVTITETTGDLESVGGAVSCNKPLAASAMCVGADLQVTISAGDPNFQIIADSGTLLTGLGGGVHTITSPINETNVTVAELGGDMQSLNLGNFNCVASSTLSATAVCNGTDLQITITNGDAPFSISVTDSVGTMDSGGQPLGVYTFTGPDTFTNIGITEDTGDLEVLNLPDVTCTASVVPVVPVAPVVLSPDLTALGCDVTALVENAPDNTYCRILMKNGAVVNYAGAIPENLIDLGVIFAVDVYRLQGGQGITDFGGYSQICLAGQGRLFYLDARTSPRTQVELATEIVNGMTCGWIPAAGTVILTN